MIHNMVHARNDKFDASTSKFGTTYPNVDSAPTDLCFSSSHHKGTQTWPKDMSFLKAMEGRDLKFAKHRNQNNYFIYPKQVQNRIFHAFLNVACWWHFNNIIVQSCYCH